MRTERLTLGALSISVTLSPGEGPPIVLCHGNSTSSRCFRRQLEGELGRRFALVAVDLAGHGESSRAADPAHAYTVPGHARVLVEAAQELGVADGVFVGWSLGGHVVLEATHALRDAAGFAIFGAPPLGFPPAMGEAFVQRPSLAVAFREDSTPVEIREYQRSLFGPRMPEIPETFREDFLRTDQRARSALAASIAPGGYADELEIVARLARPLAVFHGEHDGIAHRAYLDQLSIPSLWRRAVQVIPGVGHAAHWEDPAAFDALLAAFASDCARGAPVP